MGWVWGYLQNNHDGLVYEEYFNLIFTWDKMSFLFPRPKKKKEETNITNIGAPTNVNRVIHVTIDDKGILKGLPSSWLNQIGGQITKDEQKENPLVVKQVLQYYNYTIKKGNEDGQEFKPLLTEKDIDEESKKIDLIYPDNVNKDLTDDDLNQNTNNR